MCDGCWDGYGRPTIVNEKTEAALALVRQVYEASCGCAGGNLHIVLDDWNLEDEHINWCLAQFGECKVYFGGRKFDVTPTAIEQACGAAFLGMTMAERASTLAKYDGFLDPQEPEPESREKAKIYVAGVILDREP